VRNDNTFTTRPVKREATETTIKNNEFKIYAFSRMLSFDRKLFKQD
jgi:hypothetical protein